MMGRDSILWRLISRNAKTLRALKSAPGTSFSVKTPATSSWNLSLQKQIGSDWLFSGTYIGTETTHLWTQRQINPAVYIPGSSTTANTNQRRRFSLERPADGQLMAFISETDYGGTQSYNGLLLSAQRQAGHGVTLNANYTWSHCIGDYADVNSQGPADDETYSDPGNRRVDRSDCLGERRQSFNFTGLADTPKFSNPALRMIVSGWRLSGIYTLASGIPFTVITGSDRSLTAVGLGSANNQRVNQMLPNIYGDTSDRPLTNYLNPAAFALPALGTVGNIGRNSVRGPKTWSFDMALSRSLPIRESQRVELRIEAFNVTNSFRPGNIATQGTSGSGAFLSMATNTFGQIRNALSPRILQFALKYVF